MLRKSSSTACAANSKSGYHGNATQPLIEKVTARAYRIPTEGPEADGTLSWNGTTLVLVQVTAGGLTGTGYTYASAAAVPLIQDLLVDVLVDEGAFDIPQALQKMRARVRNQGITGLSMMAISAVDMALWDLKARLLGVSVVSLLGRARDFIDAYGSGGFTTYSHAELEIHLAQFVEKGVHAVKIKVGENPAKDIERIKVSKGVLGRVELFVDANGAFRVREACAFAKQFSEEGVTWFEEPVSSDDLVGMRFVRDHSPPFLNVTAGEYGFNVFYFKEMLEAQCLDICQVDATRCGGVTGFLAVSALCKAHHVPLSTHCAPLLHTALCCVAENAIHLEYFYDHVRIEEMLFEGCPTLKDGKLLPNDSLGFGFLFKEKEAERYRVR